jgi:hypothetical protein
MHAFMHASLALGAILVILERCKRGMWLVLRCVFLLHTDEVTGSNPVAPTELSLDDATTCVYLRVFRGAV